MTQRASTGRRQGEVRKSPWRRLLHLELDLVDEGGHQTVVRLYVAVSWPLAAVLAAPAGAWAGSALVEALGALAA